MKKVVFALLVASALLCSCKKSESETLSLALVTVKTLSTDQSCYLWVDNSTALKPTNESLKTNPFKKEVRAITYYIDKGSIATPAGSDQNWRSVNVSLLDTILTKMPVAPGKEWGTDEIEIVNDWTTCFEDGYITLCFEAMWGNSKKAHAVNLVKTDDPLVFEFKHDAGEDQPIVRSRGIVSFNVRDMPIPNTGEYDVTINYKGYYRDKSISFHYKDGEYQRPVSIDDENLYE